MQKDDEAHFQSMVGWNLERGAAQRRNLTENDYRELLKSVWDRCETDEVCALKMIFDPIVDPDAEDDKLVLDLVARVGPNGELADAPPGYSPPCIAGVRIKLLAIGSPTGGEVPSPDEPCDYLLGYFDVLGFKSMMENDGLDKVYAKYQQLVREAVNPHSEERPLNIAFSMVGGELVRSLVWIPFSAAYYSDSILLWVPYNPWHVDHFFQRCASLFCAALRLDIPLRGAVTVGKAVFNKASNVYIGDPLIEASSLESALDWIGVAVGASFRSDSLRIPIPPSMVQFYQPPMDEKKKDSASFLFADMVLDWPRIWRDTFLDSPIDILDRLGQTAPTQALKGRYASTIDFVRHSSENSSWFLRPGDTLLRAEQGADGNPH